MLTPFYTKSFKKDYKKLSAGQKEKVISVIDTLSRQVTIEPQYQDHPLKGSFKGARECHVEPNLLLVYEPTQTDLILYHISSHAKLFG